MKNPKLHIPSYNKLKTFIMSAAICIAFVICTVFSFGTVPAVKASVTNDENGIRFVQVAAGEDFAIGLTYDGDLYGWSLLSVPSGVGSDNADTLGNYYDTVPQKISVTFRAGPGANNTIWTNINYHSKSNDRIVQIAATRYTAAFITGNGYIYTWGKDGSGFYDVEYSNNSSASNYLLLRPAQSSGTYPDLWHTPYIINYGYYNADGLRNLAPATGSSYTDMSIAGAEYNYIFVYKTNSYFRSFVWGSSLYDNLQSEIGSAPSVTAYSGEVIADSLGASRLIYQTTYGNGGEIVQAVAGGYNVGLNVIPSELPTDKTTSLLLRGRNFLTSPTTPGAVTSVVKYVDTAPVRLEVGGGGSSTIYTSAVHNIDDDGTTFTGAALGGLASSGINAGVVSDYSNTADMYYARVATASGKLAFSNNNKIFSGNIYNATGVELGQDNLATSKYLINTVSLGNDVGYGISGGNLYFWGDNSVKQGVGNASSNVTTPTQILNGTTFTTVAAGKQLSAAKKALISNDTATADGKYFNDAVKNQADFISGAVSTDGSLYVWKNGDVSATELHFGGTQKSSNNAMKFAAVYSGYGHNLFAVTQTGKLVRITVNANSFEQKVYDNFKDVSGKPVTNWATANASDNTVRFSVTVEPSMTVDPALGAFTFFPNSGYSEQDSVLLNTVAADDTRALAYSGTRKSIVTSNAIGDTYRIVGKGGDENIQYLFNSVGLSTEQLKPEFTFYANGQTNGTVMTESQQQNMFDYEFVCDDTNGVGLKILPKQSSKNGKVTVKFYIARYDSTQNFSIEAGVATDNAVYYDYKPCLATFTIDNTPTRQVFQAYSTNSEGEQGNSVIPLLDPNNRYNRSFSVAVQDVSTGVDQLIMYLTGNAVANNTLKQAVLAAMAQQDLGFPASSKITAGKLNYYLGSAAASAAYNDTYKYLLSDRDADLTKINTVNVGLAGGALSGSIEAAKATVLLSVSYDGFTFDLNKIAALKTDFNNIYGIYDINVNTEDTQLEFKYDIVRLTAKDSSGTLAYASTKGVAEYQTTSNQPRVIISPSVYEYIEYTSDYLPDQNATVGSKRIGKTLNNAIAAFSQPTVRYKNDNSVYGDAAQNSNVITVTDSPLSGEIGIVADPLTVGQTRKFALSDFIEVAGNNIRFSYNNSYASFDGFNNQFVDETSSGVSVVSLSESGLTITPTTTQPLHFTVSVQRFFGSIASPQYFAGGNEKLTIKFILTQTNDFIFEKTVDSSKTLSPTVNGKISLFGDPAALNGNTALLNLGEAYRSQLRITTLISTDTSVLSVYRSDSQSEFTFNLVSSGTANVEIVVRVYGKSVKLSIPFIVAGLTTVDDDIELVDTQYVYVSSLLNVLQRANSEVDGIGTYGILANDLTEDGKPNAVYFTNAAGEELTGYPPYVKSVTLLDTTSPTHFRIRIEADADVTETSGTYNMRVRFVSAATAAAYSTYAQAKEAGVPVLETTQKLISTKSIVTVDGAILTITVDCDNPKTMDSNNRYSDWYTTQGSDKNDISVIIPVEYLLTLIGESNPNGFSVFLVTSTTGAANHFNYSFDNTKKLIVLKPLYNTVDPIVVNASVAPDMAGSGNNRILSFRFAVNGISTTLTKKEYTTVWMVAFFSSLALLLVIFLVRMIVYWRRRAKQRAIIKRNQELIKMRDRIHNKTAAATREQVVKTKLKMEDPKYAKLFNEMRKKTEAETGVSLENSSLAKSAEIKTQAAEKVKGKKGGKKSLAELKAELEAKKRAFAQAQTGTVIPDMPGGDGQNYGSPADAFAAQDLDGQSIIFDTPDPDNGQQG